MKIRSILCKKSNQTRWTESEIFYFQRKTRALLMRRHVAIVVIILLILCEEYYLRYLTFIYRDFYTGTIYIPIRVRRSHDAPNIAILVIIQNNSNLDDYTLARKTLTCYAALHDYILINLNLQEYPNYTQECPGNDFMFKRHCIAVKVMRERPHVEWFLFIDADVGLINPNRLIEEFLDYKADLTFYDRLFNYEIAAGSYLAKNNKFSHDFLLKWSLYEHKIIPKSFQAIASDNAAIHELFLDELCNECSPKKRHLCTQLWEESKDFNDIFMYESCVRSILGTRSLFITNNGTVGQRTNADRYWVRDGWQTNSHWGPNDFFIHGWKKSKLRVNDGSPWFSPFSNEEFDPKRCRNHSQAHLNWAYKNTFVRSSEEVEHKLKEVFRNSFIEHTKRVVNMATYHLFV